MSRTWAMDQRPLRCTAFEELMLDQDTPRHPCVICVRLELRGSLNIERLQHALTEVTGKHALLRSRLQCHWGKLWWHIDDRSQLQLRMHEEAAPCWPLLRYFDLSQEHGIQVDLYRRHQRDNNHTQPDQESWILFLQVHHVAADGLACVQIVQDLLTAYGQSDQALLPATRALGQRSRLGLSLVGKLRLVRQQLIGLAGVRQYMMRQPVTMTQAQHSSAAHVTALTCRLTEEQTEKLKQLAKDRNATLNDLLACFVFEAADQFRRTTSDYDAKQWLRMMVPMNLRDESTQGLSACNVVSCVFLDRTGQQISNRAELLKSIHDEMQLIKQNRLGFIFIFSLWIKKISRWRSRRRALIAPVLRRCQTSLVFSNMGRLFDGRAISTTDTSSLTASAIFLESCDVLAPIAHLMNLAVTAYQYAGRITLSMRYDSAAFTRADATRLMNLIIERIVTRAVEPLKI